MTNPPRAMQPIALASLLVLAALPIAAQTTRGTAVPIPLFSTRSAWNQRVDGIAVRPDSDAQILVTYRVLLGDVTTIVPPEGGMSQPWPMIVVNYDEFSIPVAIAGNGTQSALLREYEGADGSATPKVPAANGRATIPATAGPVRPAGPEGSFSDGHLAIYDFATKRSWDIWQATTAVDSEGISLGGGQVSNTILHAGAVDLFDVTGDGINLPTWSSARATGTPLLAGLLLPEDVEKGSIDHALALAIPGLRNTATDRSEPLPSDYFLPATTTETDYINTNPNALAAGQRLRLRDTIVDADGVTIDEAQLAPVTRMFLEALRRYGLYLVDNAGGFVTYAEDIHSARLDLTDAEINVLIGAAPGTPLPANKTTWEIVMDRLTRDLDEIPIASGAWWEYQNGARDPSTAQPGTSNFEVVENFVPRPLTRRRPVRR